MPPPGDSLSNRAGVMGTDPIDVTNYNVTDLRKGLEELDAPRRSRNQRRAERRTAGEEQVSEDEAEVEAVRQYRELLTYLENVKQNGMPSGTGGASSGASQGAGTSPAGRISATEANVSPDRRPVLPSHLKSNPFNDEAVIANKFQTIDESIPQHILSLAFNNISPPLTLFLPDNLGRLRRGQGLQFQNVGHGENAKAKVLNWEAMGIADERHMPRDEWQTAYNTFIRFIGDLADPGRGNAITQGWARHYDRMISDPDFAMQFDAFKHFDIDLRAQFFQRRFVVNPDDPKWENRLNAAKIRFARVPAAVPPHAPVAAYSSNNPHTRSVRQFTSPRHHPYNQSFRGQEINLCLRCGAQGHRSSDCRATAPKVPGRQFIVEHNHGRLSTKDGRQVCIRFNLHGCRDDPTSYGHGAHICSLCGANHGAAQCTRN
ncbi:hypothetical protein FB107DRAFT_224833 [Schizophyllum commune]